MDKFKTIDLSKSGWNFRLTICPKGTLVKVEMKEFNQKDDKYKEVKTSWSGKTLTINDIEDVLDDAIKASRPDEMKPARGKGKFFDDLNTIKEQLFDAPDEIKRSFNTLVQYFSEKYFTRFKGVTEAVRHFNRVHKDKDCAAFALFIKREFPEAEIFYVNVPSSAYTFHFRVKVGNDFYEKFEGQPAVKVTNPEIDSRFLIPAEIIDDPTNSHHVKKDNKHYLNERLLKADFPRKPTKEEAEKARQDFLNKHKD